MAHSNPATHHDQAFASWRIGASETAAEKLRGRITDLHVGPTDAAEAITLQIAMAMSWLGVGFEQAMDGLRPRVAAGRAYHAANPTPNRDIAPPEAGVTLQDVGTTPQYFRTSKVALQKQEQP